MTLQNTYAQLPERFYERVLPAKVPRPKLLAWNEEVAAQLGLDKIQSDDERARIFSGQEILDSTVPIAMAYAGHQFGHFVPQLGDGRAILLGEAVDSKGRRFDVQLKGSGVTRFSRQGDGKSAIGPVIREYIVSEAMHHLGVPTTRSLAAVATGETVERQEGSLPGAILTRVARSHIRVGHFEYFAARGDEEGIQTLFDYAVDRLYPELVREYSDQRERRLAFYRKVAELQCELIAQWMEVGFIHGVMNTDNMLVSGETIDYGPCAFMDYFAYDRVFSSIDRYGRYAYINQPAIARWNLASLATCLNLENIENEVARFGDTFEAAWLRRMGAKLGLDNPTTTDKDIIKAWLDYLHTEDLDYTLSFRWLIDLLEKNENRFAANDRFQDFEKLWRQRIADAGKAAKLMRTVNPVFIPRNHQVERAIQGAIGGDLTVFEELLKVVKNPFMEQPGFEVYARSPSPAELITETFCGT